MGPSDDIFTYELSERDWDLVRYSLVFMASHFREIGESQKASLTTDLIKKLGWERYKSFRLSRERSGEIPYAEGITRWDYKGNYLFAHPGPTLCCKERVVRPSLKQRWRCYGCGNFVKPDEV